MKTSETVERLMDVTAPLPQAVTGHSESSIYLKDIDVPVVGLPVPHAEAVTRFRLAAARLEAALDNRRAAARDTRALGRLVIITSAEDGDGKTTTALHVANALSQAVGRRAAVVEADTERPSLARMLGLGPTRGLVEVARGAAGLDDVLLRGADGGPLILTAGAEDTRITRPATLLGAINALREYHDYVLVDCAALSRSADAAVLGRNADGVLLVVRVGSTSSVSLSTALEALVDTPLLGCLLNDFDGPSRTVTRSGNAGLSRFDEEE
jgi:Mrp family chromosome partitioning ATPase